MFTSLGVIAPVIAIIATGFLAALFGLFSAQQVATMNRIVFLIAAPALLFRNVVLTQIPELIPGVCSFPITAPCLSVSRCR